MKNEFSDAQIAEFLRRSYFTVDGLWFVKCEEQRGFDEAMALDVAVWQVMSKIQARKAKSLLGTNGDSLENLARCFQLKMAAEGYDADFALDDSQFLITVRKCPWFEILRSSGRTNIAEAIADGICANEFAGWTRELAPDAVFEMRKRLCVESDNCETCEFAFTIPGDGTGKATSKTH